MNFKTELESIAARMTAVRGIFIMDTDGLVVEKVETGDTPDLEAAFVEFMQGLRSLNESAAELNLGPVEELAIIVAGFRYIFHRINDSYFLILAMDADGTLGEGSWRLRRSAANMAGEFSS